ncbi:Tyrosine phosphatase family protein [Novymonas esmeraldas]|uniref:Tyrosine phosphatase family protein n=1 Tax=Novymonas esmeraldas TaxID=1808958 RepID=A0AAW0FA66_9TRYP
MSSAELQRQRRVELQGVTNLRNLGGYHTNDGTKTTKWGVVYRGDQLSQVPTDLAQAVLVDKLHIHHTYDLRDGTEVATKSYDIPRIERCAVPIDMSNASHLLGEGENLKEVSMARRYMQNFYRDLACSYASTVGAIIKGIVDGNASSDNASLIHCTAGKDRTGWSCYVLLTLLDVREEEKRADYLLTNRYFGIPANAWDYDGAEGMSEEAMAALWTVSDTYLDAALEEVNRLGGVHEYARSHLGLTDADIQKLRALMLE